MGQSPRSRLYQRLESGAIKLPELTDDELLYFAFDTQKAVQRAKDITGGDLSKLLTVDLTLMTDVYGVGLGRVGHAIVYRELFIRAYNRLLEQNE